MKSYDIVAYTFNADILCAHCVAKMYQKVPAMIVRQVEVCLDGEANFLGIDRDDEATFDSSEFPKVVFADQITSDETCGRCGEVLL